MKSCKAASAILVLGALATLVEAGIRVEVDGAPITRGGIPISLASGSDIRFQVDGTEIIVVLPGETPRSNLAAMTGNHSIRVFDEDASSAQDPTLSIGKVTIEGSADLSVSPKLEFMVKSEAGFPSDPGIIILDRGDDESAARVARICAVLVEVGEADARFEFAVFVRVCSAAGDLANVQNSTDLNPDDLGDFINCYFGETSFPGSCPAADFNQDNSINPDDLGDYINAYFTGC